MPFSLVAAVALLAVAGAGAKHSATTISGAGSTFVSPLVSTWTPALGTAFDYTIQYSPVGSGGGIQAITNRTVDFGASDAPLTTDQFSACNGCVQIPWALAGTAIPYNVPGVTPASAAVHLKLSGDVIAKIYMGQITNWNDPAIKALNPTATMPDLKITPVYRTGNSGTTYNFTDYLSAVSPAWKSQFGTGQSVSWPTGVGRQRLGGRRGSRREHARCDLLRRHRLRDREQAALRGDQERGGQVHLPEHPQRCGGRRRGDEGAGEQRAAHRQPAEVAADGVSDRDLHLHHPSRRSRRRRPSCGRWSSGR